MKTRKGTVLILALMVIALLVVGFYFFDQRVLNHIFPVTDPLTSTPSPSPENTIQESALIVLYKTSVPETYVCLTEEDLEQFPALQAALKALEDSGKPNIYYNTSDPSATAGWNYIYTNFCDETACAAITFFKYREHFYSFRLIICVSDPSFSEIGSLSGATLVLEKQVGISPKIYVKLTEEELVQFPTLQSALKILSGNNLTEVWFEIREREGQQFHQYMQDRYKDQFKCGNDCNWNLFEYHGEFFMFSMMIA